MNATLIAKILPTKQVKYGGKRTVGTGYPLGKNLVLTARHVVVFPERDETKPITVEWSDLNHKDENAKIVFDGGVDCDVAILECQIPPQAQVSPLSLLAKQLPEAHAEWSSFGYPAIGKDEDGGNIRKKISVLGKFHPHDPNSHTISLTSDSDALEKTGWRGISGTPVFHGGRLCAVITSTPTNRSACFNAVSIPSLLADKKLRFRQAIGLDDDAVTIKKFLDGQKQQILELLRDMSQGKLFQALVAKLPKSQSNVKTEASQPNVTPDSVYEDLFAIFDKDCLALFDLLLQTSSSVLKQDASEDNLKNVRTLFCLFASLTATISWVARGGYIKLSVWTKMAAELHLAPLYGTNPDFTTTENGELKGRYSMDASVFTRETGWEQDELKKEATKIVFKSVYRKDAVKKLQPFDIKKLNVTIKQRQNRDLNQLHRFELDCNDQAFANNPLSDWVYCQFLNASDCLPDLPIVHYGEAAANLEAELSAKMEELFTILQQHGYSA